MSFEPHYINTLIIYGFITYVITVGTIVIVDKLITYCFPKPIPP